MAFTPNGSIFVAASEGNVDRVRELISGDVNVSTPDSMKRLALHYALRLPAICNEDLKDNKITIATMLIEKSPSSLSHQDNSGETPVHLMAASRAFNELLTEALQQNAGLAMIANNFGEYPIHVAIANNQLEAQSALLAFPEVRNLVDTHENTLLHHAVKANNLKLVESLVDTHHLEVNASNEDFHTPLDIAQSFHFDAMINFLKSHGGRCTSSSQNNGVGQF